MTATAPPQRLGLALAVICTVQLMVLLDVTIVNVALPSILRGLHFAPANLVWVATAYSLTFGGLMLFGGRTGDLFGRRRMFMFGTAIFALASLAGGFAQSQLWLIVARAVQGVGGAIASPTALSLIATNFPEGKQRNRAMGVYAAMSGAGASVGLLAGGILTDAASWRWVFFVNVPIAAGVLLLAPRVLMESESRRAQLDVPGAAIITAGMGLLVYGLTNAATHSWGATSTVACLAAGAGLVGVFVLVELRARYPLMPLRIFADRDRSGSYAVMLCIGMAVFGMFFFLTQYMQVVLGYSALRTGIGFIPVSAMVGVMAQVASRILTRVGMRLPLLIGIAGAAGGLFWLSRLTVHSGYTGIIGALLVIASGMGLVFVPLTLGGVARVRPEDTGLASALLNTGQQIGGAVGLALLSTIAVNAAHSRATALARVNGGNLSPALLHQATAHGYGRAFLAGSALTLLAFVVAAILIRIKQPATEASPLAIASA
jgi:EmrB/QacA subfamily drug resistance transporter